MPSFLDKKGWIPKSIREDPEVQKQFGDRRKAREKTKICPVCKTEFVVKVNKICASTNQIYCSEKCKSRATYLRTKQREAKKAKVDKVDYDWTLDDETWTWKRKKK